MTWVQLENIKKVFLDREIFGEVNLSLGKDSKIGFVGNNGTGKTTLFKIIMGALEPDDGKVMIGNNVKINYMEQIPDFNDDETVLSEALKSYQNLMDMEKNMTNLEKKMVDVDSHTMEKLLQEHGALLELYQQQGGYVYRNRTEAVLMGLGFTKDFFDLPASKLSGGQKNRLGLVRILLMPSDVILLDEPTNFLDLESIEWLENEMVETSKAFIVISHDRYFLNKVAQEIWELADSRILSFRGNYNKYKIASELRLEQIQKTHEEQKEEIKRQEDFIARNLYGQKTKQAQSRRKMLEKMDRIDAVAQDSQMRLFLKPARLGGTVALELKNLAHSYGDKVLFRNLNLPIEVGDKLAVIGPNGCGKSTLLHIIMNRIKPSAGEVKMGQRSEVAFYHQELEGLDPEDTVFDSIKKLVPTTNDGPLRDYLANFLFRGDDVYKKIGSLSGGEKSKVAFAKLIIQRPNFLILDEPTNHLDINSCQALEEALSSYEGTILFVSHDRYFINKVASRLIYYNKQEWFKFDGNYDLFVSCRDEILPKEKQQTDTKKDKQVYYSQPRRKKKYSLAELEEMIINAEEELAKLSEEMVLPEVCKNAHRMKKIKEHFDGLTLQLHEWNEEWGNWES